MARKPKKPAFQPPHIRWMIRRDMPEVLDIEERCFEFPWSEEDFICSLRQRNCIGMVAEYDEQVGGYMIYDLHKNRLRLLNLAVHPRLWRKGIGTSMVDKLKAKLHPERRERIVIEIRETNLEAQQFFRAVGFRAEKILREFYRDTDEDAYGFRYRYSEDECEAIHERMYGATRCEP